MSLEAGLPGMHPGSDRDAAPLSKCAAPPPSSSAVSDEERLALRLRPMLITGAALLGGESVMSAVWAVLTAGAARNATAEGALWAEVLRCRSVSLTFSIISLALFALVLAHMRAATRAPPRMLPAVAAGAAGAAALLMLLLADTQAALGPAAALAGDVISSDSSDAGGAVVLLLAWPLTVSLLTVCSCVLQIAWNAVAFFEVGALAREGLLAADSEDELEREEEAEEYSYELLKAAPAPLLLP